MPPKVRSNAFAKAKAKAKAEAKAKAKSKASPKRGVAQAILAGARERLVQAANARLEGRRVAIRQLNALLSSLSLDALHLHYKSFDNALFARALRALNRRCVAADQQGSLRLAVQKNESRTLTSSCLRQNHG